MAELGPQQLEGGTGDKGGNEPHCEHSPNSVGTWDQTPHGLGYVCLVFGLLSAGLFSSPTLSK